MKTIDERMQELEKRAKLFHERLEAQRSELKKKNEVEPNQIN